MKITTTISLLIVVAVAGAALAQGQRAARGVATDIKSADVQALAKTMSSMPGGDELLKVASINNGEYNVGVAVVHRAKAQNIAAGLEHSEITEIYHIISGSGTMVSGGTMENTKAATDPHTISVVGPSNGGGKFAGAVSRTISAGDVIIVPPNTAHGWTEVSDELVYLVVRMDPHKVLKVK